MHLADNGYVVWIVTAPSERTIPGIVVEESLVAKSSVVFVRLVEYVFVPAFGASHDQWLGFFSFHLMVEWGAKPQWDGA